MHAPSVSLLPPGPPRTATFIGPDVYSPGFSAMILVVDITSAGTGSITVSLQGKDPNGIYYPLVQGGPYTTVSTNVTNVNIISSNVMLPPVWRIVVTHNNPNPMIYSVSYALGNL